MKDEIKEKLVLQNYVNRYKSEEKAIINHSLLTTPLMLDYFEVKNILDYITNLQNENSNLKDELEWWKQQCDDLEMQGAIKYEQ